MKTFLTIILILVFGTAFSQPDIILIYLDDSPNGLTGSTGAPPFVLTPNIDLIKANGMDFPNNYVVVSLCAPSRAVLMTGCYPAVTGVIDNSTQANLNMSLPTLQERMQAAGYYTAVIGKFHDVFGAHSGAGWNYRLESVSQQDDKNIKWSRNGKLPKKAGLDTMITKVIIDTATAILNRVNQPVFIIISLRVPHTPFKAPAPFDTLYSSNTLPWNSDTVQYPNLYPSFLYTQAPGNYKTTAKMIPIVLNQLRSIAYLDSRLPQLFAATDSGDMIIYTSDNGWMNDEHGLFKKRWPYAPSVNVPLHIWYKDWFPIPGTSDLLTSSVDLYATILDAAGVTDTVSQGHSIRKLYDSTATRPFAYYRMHYSVEEQNDSVASSRAVWDHSYKLVRYSCNQVTEQFFNLSEMNNLINTTELQDTIAFYRDKLLELSFQYGDTSDTVINCHLITNQ